MAMPVTDETGNRYGRLLVLHRDPAPKRRPFWLCRCDCGNETSVEGNELRRGHSNSCGCLASELKSKRLRTHGLSKTADYRHWLGIIGRCECPQTHGYEYYGGRGIKICDRWRNSFEAFVEDMGKRPPGMTIDRIDTAKGYEPGNCRWATTKEQNNNRSSCVFVQYAGERLTLAQWAERTGIRRDTIKARLDMGWPAERALSEPTRRLRVRDDSSRSATSNSA